MIFARNRLDYFVRNKIFSIVILSFFAGVPVQGNAAAEVPPSVPVGVSSQTVAHAPATEAPAVSSENVVSTAPSLQPATAAPAALPAAGGPLKGAFNLNINYPGAALRYFVADGKALELLGQGQDKVFVGGLRYYLYPASLRQGGLCPYFAAEADYLSFKGSYAKGKGLGGGLYAGTEYHFNRTFSVQADLGAMYVSVKDKDTALIESGLEFLINLGVNIYFGRGKP